MFIAPSAVASKFVHSVVCPLRIELGIYFATGRRANQLAKLLSTTSKTVYCLSAFSKGTGDVRQIILSLLTHDKLENSIFLKHTGSL
jgi:hypothetical protein